MSGLLLAFSLAFSPLQSPAQEKAPPEWLIRNVIQWLPLVERWHPDFPELDPAWVLGVIAQESQGFPHVSDVTGTKNRMTKVSDGMKLAYTGERGLTRRPPTDRASQPHLRETGAVRTRRS